MWIIKDEINIIPCNNNINMKRRFYDIKVKRITKRFALFSLAIHIIAAYLFYKALNTKIIFIWNFTNKMKNGNIDFINYKCEYTNCFLMNDITGFDVTKFDAVLFDHDIDVPENRSAKHKYIFRTLESPANAPVCNEDFDTINWTWTYKLDSDISSAYFTIYDLTGDVVGPAVDIKWPAEFKPIKDDVKEKLKSKSIAAAWFVSNCYASSGRSLFVDEVQEELEKFDLTVDIYGKCGPLKCSRDNQDKCFEIIQRYYYFYFSFENSFAEDYVTEKVLIALNNYAVPVVFGGANYSRFLPPGSYLDGKKLGAQELAKQMNIIINNRTKYYDFFRWRNHFIYKKNTYEEDICKLCTIMNNGRLEQENTWKNFRLWWNGEDFKEICMERNYLYE